MSSRSVLVETDDDGAFTYERPLFGMVRGIEVDTGTLETPLVTVTDGVYGTAIYTGSPAVDGVYEPVAAFAFVAGTLKVVVTSGGPAKHGRLRFLLET